MTEYATSGTISGKGLPAAFTPPIANNNVAIGAGASSNAFSANTKLIRVHSDAICSIVIGAAPTATTADARMAANQTEYYQVVPGHKISVITNT